MISRLFIAMRLNARLACAVRRPFTRGCCAALLVAWLTASCDVPLLTDGSEPQPMVEAAGEAPPAETADLSAVPADEGFVTRRVRVVTPDPELENRAFYGRLAEESLDRVLGSAGDSLLGEKRLLVIVSPTPRDFAERTGMSPDSALAVAFPSRGHIVLNAAKLRQFEPIERIRTLDHEMVHVLLGLIAGDEAFVPLWLHEGLAQEMAGQASMTDMVRLALATITDRRIPMRRLTNSFPYGSAGAPVAYAQALSFTRFVATDFFSFPDAEAFFRFLAGHPERAHTIFAILANLETVEDLDHRWYQKQERGDSWLLLITSSSVLWIGIVFLFITAYVWKKKREREVMSNWDAWERTDDEDDNADDDDL